MGIFDIPNLKLLINLKKTKKYYVVEYLTDLDNVLIEYFPRDPNMIYS